MNGPNTKNDQLGLANKWYEVPEEVPRPQSAVEWDRKGGIARDRDIATQASYWRSRQERNSKRSRGHKDTDEQ